MMNRHADISSESDFDQRLRIALLKVVFGQAWINMVISPLVGAILCFAVWNTAEHGQLLVWLGLLIFMSGTRYLMALTFWRNQPITNVPLWERVFDISTTLTSLTWGMGVWFLMPMFSSFQQAVAFMFLIGLSGGATLSYAARQRGAILSLYSFITPLTLIFLSKSDPTYFAMGLGGVAMAIVSTTAIRRLHGFIRHSFELSLEIENARREAERRARTDDLTGALNRGAFYEMGSYLIAQAKRHNSTFSLLLIDMDLFKQINDNYGHAAGDTALCSLVELMRESNRDVDVIGRIGGDEFAVLLPDADASEAIACASRLRENLARMQWKVGDNEFMITCSMGVAEYQESESLDDLFIRADEALYESKKKGRDHITQSALI